MRAAQLCRDFPPFFRGWGEFAPLTHAARVSLQNTCMLTALPLLPARRSQEFFLLSQHNCRMPSPGASSASTVGFRALGQHEREQELLMDR